MGSLSFLWGCIISEDLNYGYKKPTAGDESGEVWMDVISDDIERLSEHAHDGDNSSLITSSSLSKFETEIVSGRTSCTGLTYTLGDTIVDLGVATATAGMYVEGDQIDFETSILGVTGTEVTLSAGVTGNASATGEIIFSRWNRKDSNVYEYELTLPSGYESRKVNYSFFISNSGDTYENYKTNPDVIVNQVNTVKVQVNDSRKNLKAVVL